MKSTLFNSFLKIIISLIIFIPFSIAQNNKTRVIGGGFVQPDEYKWMARTWRGGYSESTCCLIAPQWLITAAHVLPDSALYGYPDSVCIHQFSRTNPSPDRELIPIERIFKHPGWVEGSYVNFGHKIDLALIKLKRPAITAPATLGNIADTIYYETDTPCTILGWGYNGYLPSDTLKIGRIKIINFDTCKAHYDKTPIDLVKTIDVCAGYKKDEPAEGSAWGDSGGPLFLELPNGVCKIIGIVKGGYHPETDWEYPGIYTRLISFKPWIDSIMQTSIGIKDITPFQQAVNLIIKENELTISATNASIPKPLINIYDTMSFS